MIIEPLGDAAFILRDLRAPSHLLADALIGTGSSLILDAWPSYDTVGVSVPPNAMTADDLRSILDSLPVSEGSAPREHMIPVCYQIGEDLEIVAKQLGINPEQVVAFHSSTSYQCFAVGFCPGFPYLGSLPEELHGIPRMQTPRTHTQPGAVGITGKQTAIYPLDRPGGWPIIGITPLTIVDVDENYFPIRAGDVVRFNPIDEKEFQLRKGERL